MFGIFLCLFFNSVFEFFSFPGAEWKFQAICVENCHFGKSFFFFLIFFLLSLVFLSFIRFILPRCCWSFVVLCSLVLFLSFLSFSVSSGLLYFSWEFFNLCLFILEGSDSLVSISGFRPLPGWGPHQVNNVYSSRPWTAGMAVVENPPPPFFPPTPSGWPWELVNW